MEREGQPALVRSAAVRGVHTLVQPSYPLPPGRRRPMVFVEGGHGTGKTTLVDSIVSQVNQYVPYGRVDFTEPERDDLPQTLSVLARQLAWYRPRYRRLRFPRLLIGLLVMKQDLSEFDFERARSEVSQLLQQRRGGGWPQQFLMEMTGNPAEVDIPMGFATLALQIPLNALVNLAGFTFPGRAQRWYGHRDRELVDDPIDTLLELNTWARDAEADPTREPGRSARGRVDALLCEAFLADLRDCPRRVHALPTPLLLLDNADAAAGLAFLGRLLQARPALRPQERPEPLTVVATGRSELPDMAETTTAPLEDLLGAAPERRGGDSPAWLSYRLPLLTLAEVQTLLSRPTGRGGADRRLARLVHEFTGGHPQAVGLLAQVAGRRGPTARSVAELLARPVTENHGEPAPPGAGGTPAAGREPAAGEYLLRRLLPVDEAQIDAHATCSAARSEEDRLWLSHQSDLVNTAWGETIRRDDSWDQSGGTSPAVLRRLLLRDLAARPPAHHADWSTVHDRLRGRCRRNGDKAGELYHRLAMDDLSTVALELARLLPDMAGDSWLELLQTVARSPFRAAEHQDLSPNDQFHEQVRDIRVTAPDDTVAETTRLLAALRIVSDPSGGVERRFLYAQISITLDQLAPQSPDGLVALSQAAAEYSAQPPLW
ncbi:MULTISPECIES: hypothetical protein [unclassified Streptomyces]|uniref:hypothetical protein n=1 Tax=unclassified Streptomyces TaxID=2593676 RepID=UPI001F0487C1|nr:MULTISPECIES: hypothetical protein [unclassified Streptomyces]MCH0564798.1 hypothetical protein [Streptomyces sp. MUM 2J]MCH0569920.1 hypothetical protein [Streptomyces sp. MUM 136J]